ncbi:DUF1905 domain-containing protein [Allosphingosinicella vermicomposti]|uniref:DUF1905 domain-containing protein n=1 Tax=Allosphingosinicella vermicomposti TaxID=614671 RepID=UPI000D0E8810|nr:DUF1905 domain-containing protein [Allosphingosinicella vermicomposti]
MLGGETIEVTGEVWKWRPAEPEAAGWHFLTVDGAAAAEIRYAAIGRTGGFGSIKVTATIGGTTWRTSLFPHKESGGFLLPLKADVRKKEAVDAGSMVTALLDV